jgi:energy-coupling factor transporter transmembrane protein EcfT
MALAPLDLLGTGTGPLALVSPPVRLIVGGATIIACILSPRGLGAGALFVVGIAAATFFIMGAPLRVAARALSFGAFLYLPLALILLVPALFEAGGSAAGRSSTGAISTALATAAAIALKGCVTLLVALSTLTTLRRAELQMAVAGLPLPRMVRLLLLQILHQTGLLIDETVRIRRALAVRAPARSGIASVRVMAALPRVWLERVAARAERTALALELRGYHLHGASPLPPPPARGWADALALTGAVFALIASLALHLLV